MAKPAPKTEKSELAEAIVEVIKNQIGLLLLKHWPEIQTLLDEDHQITIGAKLAIDDTSAKPGDQPDKNNRVRTTISFAKKVSDSTESPLPNPSQGELPIAS